MHQDAPAAAETECRICMEEIAHGTKGLVQPCGHDAFHRQCFADWHKACVGHCRCPCCNIMVTEYLGIDGRLVSNPLCALGRLGQHMDVRLVPFFMIVMFIIASCMMEDDPLVPPATSSPEKVIVLEPEEEDDDEPLATATCCVVAVAFLSLSLRRAFDGWQREEINTEKLLVTAAVIGLMMYGSVAGAANIIFA